MNEYVVVVSSSGHCYSKAEAGRRVWEGDFQDRVQCRGAEWLDGVGFIAREERTQTAWVESRSVVVSAGNRLFCR